MEPVPKQFANKHYIAKLLDISTETLKNYRKQKKLQVFITSSLTREQFVITSH
jgi:DNA-binding CsgD family transcriptional regulator